LLNLEGYHHYVIVISDKDWINAFLKITFSNLSQPKLYYAKYNDYATNPDMKIKKAG